MKQIYVCHIPLNIVTPDLPAKSCHIFSSLIGKRVHVASWWGLGRTARRFFSSFFLAYSSATAATTRWYLYRTRICHVFLLAGTSCLSCWYLCMERDCFDDVIWQIFLCLFFAKRKSSKLQIAHVNKSHLLSNPRKCFYLHWWLLCCVASYMILSRNSCAIRHCIVRRHFYTRLRTIRDNIDAVHCGNGNKGSLLLPDATLSHSFHKATARHRIS